MTTVVLLQFAVASLLAGALASLATARYRRLSGWVSVGFVTASALLLWAVVLRAFSAAPDPPGCCSRSRRGCRPGRARGSAERRVPGDHRGDLPAHHALLGPLHGPLPGDTLAKYYPVLQVLFAASSAWW